MSGVVNVRLNLSVSQYTAMLRALRLHGNATNQIAKRIENNIKQQKRYKIRKEKRACA